MKERIKTIMDTHDMSPARFADSLNIGRAVISHILTGRNNPSLDVITRILTNMPEINPEWLLTGKGSMKKNQDQKETIQSDPLFPDLFSQIPLENPTDAYNESEINKYSTENIVNSLTKEDQTPISERIIYKENPAKKIKQIIIYYTDNTFESFNRD